MHDRLGILGNFDFLLCLTFGNHLFKVFGHLCFVDVKFGCGLILLADLLFVVLLSLGLLILGFLDGLADAFSFLRKLFALLFELRNLLGKIVLVVVYRVKFFGSFNSVRFERV